jgi:HD-GYP domain-containing protein (c-di-GMP phosphodiesterase class II)
VSDSAALQEEGRKLLTAFYATLSALKLYPVENAATQQAITELHNLMSEAVLREGGLELRIVGDFFFLNETRLRLDLSNFATFGSFARALADHGVGAVEVLPGVDRSEWAPFVALLLRKPEAEAYAGFMKRIAQTPVEHILFQPEHEVQEPDIDEEESLAAAKRTYAQSVNVAKDVLTDMRLGKAVNVRKVKRAVQNIVDQVLNNESSMVTMTTLRDFDEYTFTHSVNVCIFSVVIGQRLGLTKMQLYELGLGALFHDVGKSRLDPDVINKPGSLSDDEWETLKQHPTEGLLMLFHMLGFADVPYRQMLIAYEHHMKIDLTGYPETKRERQIGLFSKIVAVADGFDAGTSVRSYQYDPWPPDEVLKEMRDNPRRGFDPLVVKTFITATGVYPVGSMVILDTYELGVVVKANSDPNHFHQPLVKIISNEMGVPIDPISVDLALGGRTIIKTTDAQKYGVRVSDYLL